MSDTFEFDPTKSDLMADIMQRGLGFNVDPASDGEEAPYGPADVIQTGPGLMLAETFGGAELVESDEGDTEL